MVQTSKTYQYQCLSRANNRTFHLSDWSQRSGSWTTSFGHRVQLLRVVHLHYTKTNLQHLKLSWLLIFSKFNLNNDHSSDKSRQRTTKVLIRPLLFAYGIRHVFARPGPCDASSEFVSSSIRSWQILTAHAQPFRGARDLAFCLKVPLDSLLVWASSGGSSETAQMRRVTWTVVARIGDKYQIRLTWPILKVDEKATISYRYNWIPHPALDTK